MKTSIKIKVCGLNNVKNIETLSALAIDYFGFIFYNKSPRSFRLSQIPISVLNSKRVGVFVNCELSEVVKKTKMLSLSMIQLHGNETEDYCKKLKHLLNKEGLTSRLTKVFSIENTIDFKQLTPFIPYADNFLFDTQTKGYGGSGKQFNWNVLENYPFKTPFFLSGGIGYDDLSKIQSFLEKTSSRYCHAIDLNSRFETEPGIKNIKLIEQFINQFKL